MKKILIGLYYYEPYVSGLTIYVKNLAENLVKDGYEVTIFCARHLKKLPLKEEINGVKIIREKVLFSFGKGVVMPLFFWKIVKLSKKFDIVNIHLPNADLGLSSLFLKKDKLFVTYHCDINLGKGFLNKMIEKISFFLMEISMKKAKKIIGNSREYFLNSYFKKYEKKFVEITPPINFSGIEKGKDFVKISNSNTFKIGFLGRIVYEKGINFLLESLLKSPLKEKDFHLYIGGDYENIRGGSIISELKDLIEKTKEKVTFLGNIKTSELKDFYEKIDVLVLPSFDPLESFGMVQIEAMFNNTPVIASNMPGVNTVVNKTGFGYITKTQNSKDLAEKINLILEEKEKYDLLKKQDKLKNSILENFGLQKTISKYKKLFDK